MRAVLLLCIALQTVFSAAQAQDAVKWYDRVSFSGDMRLRHEYIDKDEKDNSNHRQRIRVRLKAEGQVEENLKAVFQIASGNSEAVSTNQTLDGGYNNKNVDISLAYLMWTPTGSIDVLGGKVKNTLYIPGDSELLFDADLNPEGTTLNWRHKLESGSSFFANAGIYWYDERDAETTAGSDIHQYSAQLGMNLAFDESQLTFGIGHHSFGPIAGDTVIGTNSVGNSITGTVYNNRYETSEAFVSYALKSGLNVYAQYAQNGDVSDDNTAYIAGVIYGKPKVKGDWSLSYSYRLTEKDALLGALKDSDFANGETDSSGHKLSGRYQVGNATIVALTYFMNERNISGDGTAALTEKGTAYDRAQLDLSASF